MQEAGLTPYQVLESGTRNVAEYAAKDLNLDGKFGTVAPGNRADLILLDANPLADARNVAKRAGVMVRGRWLPPPSSTECWRRWRRGRAGPKGSEECGMSRRIVSWPWSGPRRRRAGRARPDERDAVLAVVQRLWDGMRTRDTALVRSVFDSSAMLARR